METGGQNGPPMENFQRKALAELGRIYLGRGPFHSTARAVAVLVKGALLPATTARRVIIAKLQLEQGIVPPSCRA